MNLDDLMKMSKKELLEIKGFGDKSYIELCEKLNISGIKDPEKTFESEGR